MNDDPSHVPPAPDDTGHPFTRERRAAHLPETDVCVICGAGEAAHFDDRPLAELQARFGPSGWEIQSHPGGVAVWLAVKKNGSSTRVIAAYGPGELYAKLQAADQKDRDEGRPL